jgi:hypothetical protein
MILVVGDEFCFTSGKEPPVPIGEEVEWAPEPVWTTRRNENV